MDHKEAKTMSHSKPRRGWRAFSPALMRWGAIPALIVIVGLALGVFRAQAVHDNSLFQLDGNANASPAPPPPCSGCLVGKEDWDSYFPSGTATTAVATAFITDKTGLTDDIFT